MRWLEDLGRTDDKTFSRKWRIPQAFWIGEKNAERSSAAWRPYNGPLSPASRRNAIVVVRQLFKFLKRTGYLSPKVPLLKGEGAPQAFADRSLTPEQWSEITGHLSLIPEGQPRERMKLILMLGKSLGLRASEMLEARTGWIVRRSFGGGERPAVLRVREIQAAKSDGCRSPLSSSASSIRHSQHEAFPKPLRRLRIHRSS